MRVSAKQYAQILYDLTDGKSKPEIEKTAFDFARYIYRNRKLKIAGKIIEQFASIHDKKKAIVEVEAATRKKLDDAEVKKIKHFVKDKYGAKKVVLKNVVDEKIKGGIVLKVGDEVIDGSVRGKLERLKEMLVK